MDDRQYNNNNEIVETEKETAPRPLPFKKRRIKWNRLGVMLIIVGVILYGLGFLMGARGASISFQNGWFHFFSVSSDTTGSREITLPANAASASNIIIHTTSANIVVRRSADNQIRLVAYGGMEPTVTESAGTLTINTRQETQSRSVTFLSVGVQRHEIRLYLPYRSYEQFNISSSSGNITIENFYLHNLITRSSSGNTRINNVAVHIGNTNNSSGNLVFNGGSIFQLTSSTSSGNINIETIVLEGGNAGLQASSGNIRFTAQNNVLNLGGIDYNLITRSGSIRINGERAQHVVGRNTGHSHTHPFFFVNARASSGNVRLYFD
jgi:DUF4097 and DUF4098 domain-containing protein YvlB